MEVIIGCLATASSFNRDVQPGMLNCVASGLAGWPSGGEPILARDFQLFLIPLVHFLEERQVLRDLWRIQEQHRGVIGFIP
jgi:hypothetical protein